ncbi:MAG: CBS domain-containing protein [Candidatus Aenigmarchaeota archaeon]|nr:CBS domain-containing protein [Candidatus Aenigmarchaeota archaeon]
MEVQEVMTKGVQTINKGSTIKEAAEAMSKFNIGCLIVVQEDSKKMLGMLTERDIVKFVAQGNNINNIEVDSIMNKQVYFVRPTDDLDDAVEVMVKNKVTKIPVIEGSALVGILTTSDVASAEPRLIAHIAA